MNCLFCESVTKNQKYCSNQCQANFEYLSYLERWFSGLEYPTIITGHIVHYIKDKYNNKCSKCGWNKINPSTNKSPLEINHIDGDSTNNCEDNLELLCPNCHSLTPTYKALNKGNGHRKR